MLTSLFSEPLKQFIIVLGLLSFRAKLGCKERKRVVVRNAVLANQATAAMSGVVGSSTLQLTQEGYCGPALDFAAAMDLVTSVGFAHVGEGWLRGYWAVCHANEDGLLDALEVNKLLAAVKRDFEPLNKERAFEVLTAKMGFDISQAFFIGTW